MAGAHWFLPAPVPTETHQAAELVFARLPPVVRRDRPPAHGVAEAGTPFCMRCTGLQVTEGTHGRLPWCISSLHQDRTPPPQSPQRMPSLRGEWRWGALETAHRSPNVMGSVGMG